MIQKIKSKIDYFKNQNSKMYLSFKKIYYVPYKILFQLFSVIFKIKKNKIILTSNNHTKISCNPKHLSDYILEYYGKGVYDLVWVTSGQKIELDTDQMRKVNFLSLKYIYEMSTAKIVIENVRSEFIVGKRKGQIYVQLWHSSARLKKIEADAEKYFSPYLKNYYVPLAKNDSRKIDVIFSGSRHSTEIFNKAFWYSGKIIEVGTPRNDILLINDDKKKREIKEGLNLDSNTKIVFYVPTFRENYHFDYNLFNAKKIKSFLKTVKGGEWEVLVRYHPNLRKKDIYHLDNDESINVSSYEDIQELLLIADILITDFSSVMFDYLLTKKPCLLFVPDLEEYLSKERELYFNIDDLPFPVSLDFDSLEHSIINFNEENYISEVDDFINQIGSCEKGDASEKIMKYLEKEIK